MAECGTITIVEQDDYNGEDPPEDGDNGGDVPDDPDIPDLPGGDPDDGNMAVLIAGGSALGALALLSGGRGNGDETEEED